MGGMVALPLDAICVDAKDSDGVFVSMYDRGFIVEQFFVLSARRRSWLESRLRRRKDRFGPRGVTGPECLSMSVPSVLWWTNQTGWDSKVEWLFRI